MASAASTGLHEYLQVGDTARLLLQGQQGSHSVTGRVDEVSVDYVELSLQDPTRTIKFPSAKIASCEVRQAGLAEASSGAWRSVSLPPSLSVVVGWLEGALLTGSGALLKDLDESQLSGLSKTLGAVYAATTEKFCRELVNTIRATLDPYQSMLRAQTFDEAEREHRRVLVDLKIVTGAQGEGSSSDPLVLAISGVARRLGDLANRHWARYQAAVEPRPRLIRSIDPLKVSVARNGEATLPFRLHLEDSYAPAQGLTVTLDEIRGVQRLGGQAILPRLEPGQEITLGIPVTVDKEVLNQGNLQIKGQVSFMGPSGRKSFSPKQTVEFTLVLPEEFQEIVNPYTAYAGGTTVSDPNMFFGRDALIKELSFELSAGPPGQCFALYGQKRTGKSSLLEQVKRQLPSPSVTASISFGTIDFDSAGITAALVREVLEQVRVPLLTELPRDKARRLDDLWPDDRRINDRPLESLRTALLAGRRLLAREEGWAGLRFVLLIDEFTYLFEVLRNPDPNPNQVAGVRDFMRQWKALLESQTFSALVLGQDTMPYFMQRFPNEFSSLTTRRLSYLDYMETISLADRPIARRDGSSRYTGHALAVLHDYTDGHPFFTQILCERLVRRANRAKRADLGEQDVLEAIESLLSGEQMIDFHRFDCFLTADNTGLVASAIEGDTPDGRDAYDLSGEAALRLLARIATLGGHQNRHVPMDALNLTESDGRVLEDLVLREVLVRKDGSVRIRVALFADYLRRQW